MSPECPWFLHCLFAPISPTPAELLGQLSWREKLQVGALLWIQTCLTKSSLSLLMNNKFNWYILIILSLASSHDSDDCRWLRMRWWRLPSHTSFSVVAFSHFLLLWDFGLQFSAPGLTYLACLALLFSFHTHYLWLWPQTLRSSICMYNTVSI